MSKRIIEVEVKPISSAPKVTDLKATGGLPIIMSWWDQRPVFIAWVPRGRDELVSEPGGFMGLGLKLVTKTVDAGSKWYFAKLMDDGTWSIEKPCGYFIPQEWASVPCLDRAITVEEEPSVSMSSSDDFKP